MSKISLPHREPVSKDRIHLKHCVSILTIFFYLFSLAPQDLRASDDFSARIQNEAEEPQFIEAAKARTFQEHEAYLAGKIADLEKLRNLHNISPLRQKGSQGAFPPLKIRGGAGGVINTADPFQAQNLMMSDI